MAEVLVGRARELALVSAFVERTRTDGEALLLSGDPGTGKTALLEAAVGAAVTAGTSVLRAAGVETGVDRCLLVAPSVRFFEFREDAFVFAGDKTIFIGDKDEFCDVSEATELAARLGAKLKVFEGFDHHFMKSRRFMAEAALPVLVPAGV